MAWMIWRLFFRKKQAKAIAWGGLLNIKRALRAVVYIFNLHTVVLLVAACLAIYVCDEMGWSFNMDFSMISTGTVFPLTFTLAQAFTRRERATALIASIKASAVALYFMHRDWDQSLGYPGSMGNDDLPGPVAAKKLIMNLLLSIKGYLVTHGPFESVAEARLTAGRNEWRMLFEHDMHLSEKSRLFRATVQQLLLQDPSQRNLKDCYKWLSQLSVLNEKLTLASGYTRGGEGGLSRTNQYLRYIIANLEELRSIKEYRTPTMMRHACGVLFHIFAILLAPYFTHFCANQDLEVCLPGYASACAYVLIVMLLYHVQQDMENCMDETGLDDAFFHVAEEVDQIAGAPVLRSARSSCSDMSHMVRGQSPPARMQSMDRAHSCGPPGHGQLRSIPSDKALPSLEMDPLLGRVSLAGIKAELPSTLPGHPPWARRSGSQPSFQTDQPRGHSPPASVHGGKYPGQLETRLSGSGLAGAGQGLADGVSLPDTEGLLKAHRAQSGSDQSTCVTCCQCVRTHF